MTNSLSGRPLVLAAILAVAAGSCRNQEPWTPAREWVPPALAMSPAAQERGRAELTEWQQRAWPRPGLLRPRTEPRPCRAGDRYRAAIELLEPNRDELQLNDRLWDPERWGELKPELAELLDSPFATSVAEAVLAGAACRDGATDSVQLPWVDDSFMSFLHLAETSSMIALRWADGDRALDAAYLLAAVMQMGFDLARDGDLMHLRIGWQVIRPSFAALDHIAGRLDAAGLDEISEACRLVIDAAPSYQRILRGERMAAMALALWSARGGMAGAEKKDPEFRDTLKLLEATGGEEGFLERFDRLVEGMAGIDDEPLPAALAHLDRVAAEAGWPAGFFDPADFLPEHRVGLAMARARQVALAVRARKLRTGSWPADLGFLGDLADDPRTGKPFGYVPGEAIRGEAVACGKDRKCGNDAVKAPLQ